MNISENQIIGELVAQDYKTAGVFKNYNIDFCCNGNRSILEACQNQKINIESIMDDLKAVSSNSQAKSIDYQAWPLDLLVDYIEKTHHKYVENKIIEIKPYLEKICRVHGDRHPELFEIEKQFKASSDELTVHMKKEEFILFPYIRKAFKASEQGLKIEKPPFGEVENPIDMMKHEHNEEGERFRAIANLSNNYTPPTDACNTYKVTFSLLQEFENDLHLHIHLENNIVFPAALKLEKLVAA